VALTHPLHPRPDGLQKKRSTAVLLTNLYLPVQSSTRPTLLLSLHQK
jgi:hypothetical protein